MICINARRKGVRFLTLPNYVKFLEIEAAELPLVREIAPSVEKLMASLISYHNTHNKSPRAVDCRKENGLYDRKTYLKTLRLDTWAKVLSAVGLPTYFEKFNGGNEIETLIELNRFIRINKIDSYEKYGIVKKKQCANLPSATALVKKYGSWNEVLKHAGVTVNQNRYDKKMFTKELKKIASNGNIPSLNEFAKHLGIPARTITKRLGPFNEFLISQGFIPQYSTPETVIETNEQLKKLYIEFSQKNGYVKGAPTRALDQSDEIYSSDVFCIRFGSINELRKECGYETVKRGTRKEYTTDQITNILLSEYNKYGRRLTNQEISDNAALPSISTIMRYFKTTSMETVWETILNN